MKITRQSLRFFYSSLILVTGFMAPIARGDTIDVVGSDNAFVLRSSATADQDESTTITTKRLNDSNTRIAYVRFDLTSFFATHTVNGLTAVTLRLYQTSAIADTMRVYGLDSSIGGTNEFDDVWTGSMIWNNQPAGLIANAAAGLPTNTTSGVLGTLAMSAAAGEVDIPLTLADFKSYLTTNGNAKITLLFHNTGNNNINFASLGNTSFLKPTLQLSAPVLSAGSAAWSGAVNGDWDTNTLNWTSSGSPTNFMPGYGVTFDESLVGNSTVNLTASFTTAGVTVSNNATDYTFTGSGNITGQSLTKTGSGKLTIDNSTDNGFSSITISNGTIQLGNADGNGSFGSAPISNFGSLVFNKTNATSLASISGTGSLIKNGSGTLTFAANSTYNGPVIVNNGTFVASGFTGNALLSNAAPATLAVSGSNSAAVFFNGTLSPGNVSSAATFSGGSNANLGSTAMLIFDVGSTNTEGSGVNDLLLVSGNLAEAGTVKVLNSLGTPQLGVPYTLARFGSKSGSFSSTLAGSHYSGVFSQTATNLTVTFSGSGANLKWNSSSSTSWDAGVNTNWLNGSSPDYFYQGDGVTFDDTATQPNVVLAGAMSPSSVTVNSSGNNYTFTGNKITGTGGIIKNGASTLTLSNANDFTGTVSILNGIVRAGNNTALGATNAGTTVASGAALDFFGHAIGAETVAVSGSGPDAGAANGALYNSGANTPGNQALQRLTLTGDTYIGGSGRWDLRGSVTGDATGASLSTGNQPYKIIKVGGNLISLANLTIDPALGDLDVTAGTVELNNAVTSLGNTASNLFVRSGAILQLFQLTNVLNKKFSLDDSATINSANGTNTIIGPMALNGTETFAVPVGMLVLSNVISGSGSLSKTSTNTLVLAGTDNHTGRVSVSDGILVLNTTNNSGNELTLTAVSGFTMRVILGGNGAFNGAADVEDTLWPGVGGKPSTLRIGNNVDYSNPDTGDPYLGALSFGYGGNTTAMFSLNTATTTGGGVNDLVVVNGNVYPDNSRVIINPLTPLLTGSTYTLMTYSGSLNTTVFGSASLLPSLMPSRYQFTLNQGAHAMTLTVNSGVGTLRWNNNAGTGIWDITNSFNWFNTTAGTNDYFAELDSVLFDDTPANIPANTQVTVSTSVSNGVAPAALVVSSDNNNYTWTGPSKITGPTGLTKTGASLLTIGTTNTFTGDVLIKGGTVRILNTNALGSWLAGTVTITNGATLDLGGWPGTSGNANNMFGAKPFFISGAGVTNGGAIVNNGAIGQNSAFEFVTLTTDATIGGTARFDWRNGTPGPVLDLAGHTLTKAGNNQVSLVNVTCTNGGSIVINSGILSFETTSVVSNGTVVINAGGTLGHFRTAGGAFTRAITLNGGVITNLSTSGGGSTNDGNINLTANSFIGHPAGSDLVLNGVISESGGSFGFTKNGAGRTALTANETYTGNTLVIAGTLALTGTGNIAGSSNVTVQAGATLEVSSRTNGTFTVTSGRNLNGGGTIAGSLSNAPGGIVAPGTSGAVGILTVTSNANLNGTTFLKLNASGNTNDVVSVAGNIVIGGTLSVSNIAGSLAGNQVYKLFNAATYTTNYTGIVPSTPGPNMVWDVTGLSSNGTLKVVSIGPPPVPRITTIGVNGTTLTLVATNGPLSGPWTLLQSTNLAIPFAQWLTNRSGSFDANGNLSTNIANVVTNGREYYILKY